MMKPPRTQRTPELQNQIRNSLPTIPNVTTSVEDIQFVDTGSEKPVKINLFGDDPADLNRSGLSRSEAILKAGPVRLRPILMTTASTILGMLPIALGWGAGSELRSPMAIAIIGGLISSTLLSLIVVPVVYTLLDDWQPRKVR